MAQIKYIKHLWEKEEKSLREISRTTGLNQKTVTKYAYMENWSAEKPPEIFLKRYSILAEFIPIIDEWWSRTPRNLVNSQGIKQLMAGGGIVVIGMKLIPLLGTLFN